MERWERVAGVEVDFLQQDRHTSTVTYRQTHISLNAHDSGIINRNLKKDYQISINSVTNIPNTTGHRMTVQVFTDGEDLQCGLLGQPHNKASL